MKRVPMRTLVEQAIGGGWGSSVKTDDSVLTRVLRGADFPDASVQRTGNAPQRWETETKVRKRTLDTGDIVLEVSGGTKNRPTGRSIYVTDKMVEESIHPLIPASFCRKIKVDREIANPRFVYYWLQSMYQSGRAWNYQNQSTGIANFQFEQFLDDELVWLPSLNIQTSVATLLGSLDDKIAANTSAYFLAEQLVDAFVYENISASRSVSIADELILHYGKSLPASKRVPGQIPVVGSGGIVGWHSSPLIEDPTVVVGRKGSIGALHWIDSSSFPIDTTFWVQPKRLPTRILYSLLKLVDFSGSNTDSAVPGLNRSVAYEMPLPFISDEAVAAVWDKVSSLDAFCSHLKREVACLTKTRDELLPLLMSGKITVKEAEQEASAAGADIASEENKA